MDADRTGCRRGFTLVELLVVVGVVVVLMAILLPALGMAKDTARRTACLSNLHQIGLAIQTYAQEWNGRIPAGPKAPPFISPSQLYTATGMVTSQISLSDGRPAGLGLLLSGALARQPKVLFCPGPDQSEDASAELAKVGQRQAQGSYYYRHASVTALFDNANVAAQGLEHLLLSNLGDNTRGRPIRALAIDTQFVCPADPGLASFDIRPRTHHQRRFADILYSDGHAVSCANKDQRFTVRVTNVADLYTSLDAIRGVLEQGDAEP